MYNFRGRENTLWRTHPRCSGWWQRGLCVVLWRRDSLTAELETLMSRRAELLSKLQAHKNETTLTRTTCCEVEPCDVVMLWCYDDAVWVRSPRSWWSTALSSWGSYKLTRSITSTWARCSKWRETFMRSTRSCLGTRLCWPPTRYRTPLVNIRVLIVPIYRSLQVTPPTDRCVVGSGCKWSSG